MEKLTVGRSRKRSETESVRTSSSDWLVLTGLCTMCLMLVLAMLPTDADSLADTEIAVAVMSSGVENSTETEREELVLPDKKASVVADESVFETIGEFFAALITGEG